MTTPDYPLPALGSYETYQLAHIATYIAERIARHRASGRGRDGRIRRAEAVRDLAAAATALDAAAGSTEPIPAGLLPRPIDASAYAAARELVTSGPRSADVVSLAGAGGHGWAVIGQVPGVGPVGATVGSQELAEALRQHMLTRPVEELAAWAVTAAPLVVPTLPQRVDLAAFVEQLDPGKVDDRAIARALRGVNRRTDAAIRGRFRDVDLDAPPIVAPPSATTSSPGTGSARQRSTPARRAVPRRAGRGVGIQRPTPAATPPRTSAGP